MPELATAESPEQIETALIRGWQRERRGRHSGHADPHGKRVLQVFKHLNDWWEEFRLYHRKDGKVHKEGDDLMSATRYGCMMLRYARTAAAHDRFNRDIVYPRHGYA